MPSSWKASHSRIPRLALSVSARTSHQVAALLAPREEALRAQSGAGRRRTAQTLVGVDRDASAEVRANHRPHHRPGDDRAMGAGMLGIRGAIVTLQREWRPPPGESEAPGRPLPSQPQGSGDEACVAVTRQVGRHVRPVCVPKPRTAPMRSTSPGCQRPIPLDS